MCFIEMWLYSHFHTLSGILEVADRDQQAKWVLALPSAEAQTQLWVEFGEAVDQYFQLASKWLYS